MGRAADYLTTSVIASRLYQVWGDLTDRFELKPEERAEALDAMKQAAGEWGSGPGRRRSPCVLP